MIFNYKKFYYFAIGAGLFLIFVAKEGEASSSIRIQKKLDQIHIQEPRFDEIAQEAMKNEKLDLASINEWKKKMKKAPWLPKVSLGYDHSFKESSAISISDNISVSSDTVTVGPDDNDLDQSIDQGNVLRFRAIWSLDQLVFHSATLSASQEGREISQSRLRLSDYLSKIYSQRSELLGKYYLLKSSSPSKALLVREQIRVLTEQLDFFTDNAFAHQWWRGE